MPICLGEIIDLIFAWVCERGTRGLPGRPIQQIRGPKKADKNGRFPAALRTVVESFGY
jgi:hypothetical protein